MAALRLGSPLAAGIWYAGIRRGPAKSLRSGVPMLKTIPPVLSPDLLHAMMSMGHGDELLIADSNFPAARCAQRLVRADGHGALILLEAILKLLPLDTFEPHAAFVMQPVHESDPRPAIWRDYEFLIERSEERPVKLHPLERYEFYARAKQAFVIVATGETAIYGNLLLKKGNV